MVRALRPGAPRAVADFAEPAILIPFVYLSHSFLTHESHRTFAETDTPRRLLIYETVEFAFHFIDLAAFHSQKRPVK